MSSNFKHISIVVASLVLIGCGGGGSSTETPTQEILLQQKRSLLQMSIRLKV